MLSWMELNGKVDKLWNFSKLCQLLVIHEIAAISSEKRFAVIVLLKFRELRPGFSGTTVLSYTKPRELYTFNMVFGWLCWTMVDFVDYQWEFNTNCLCWFSYIYSSPFCMIQAHLSCLIYIKQSQSKIEREIVHDCSCCGLQRF